MPQIPTPQQIAEWATAVNLPPNTFNTWQNPFVTGTHVNAVTEDIAVPSPDPQLMSFDEFINPKTPALKKNINLMLLQDVYKYNVLKLDKTRSHAFEKNANFKPTYKWCTTNGYVGIEIEVENIKDSIPLEAYWNITSDNSLRNHGCELVSVPLQVKQVELALHHVTQALKTYNQPDFSPRTSIHIHLNVRDMTLDQIWVLTTLYALFERHFYAVVGTKRLNSIFCVPLFRTNQLSVLDRQVYSQESQWHKYSGLNLQPLYNHDGKRGYGTVEFRHLYGTLDNKVILDWINDILCLRKAALTLTKDELLALLKEMNTTSSYFSFYNRVFSGGRQVLKNKFEFESCISHIKREFFGNDYYNAELRSIRSERCEYFNVVKNLKDN